MIKLEHLTAKDLKWKRTLALNARVERMIKKEIEDAEKRPES